MKLDFYGRVQCEVNIVDLLCVKRARNGISEVFYEQLCLPQDQTKRPLRLVPSYHTDGRSK